MSEIKLGDKVKDKITGFIGIAVCRSEFLNGCVQWSIAPKVSKDNKILEEIGIDEQSLEVINPKRKLIKKQENGGPITRGRFQRGF